jgi:molecular chaperone GrpE (heat shock protein)
MDVNELETLRISKKKRQHNDQKKKYKRTNNDLQNIHIKLKIEYDIAIRRISKPMYTTKIPIDM